VLVVIELVIAVVMPGLCRARMHAAAANLHAMSSCCVVALHRHRQSRCHDSLQYYITAFNHVHARSK
jgi:hypothetical protein